MRFLSAIWLPALALVLLAGLLNDNTPGTIGAIGLVWLYSDIPITVGYLGYRVFFRAKRDAQARELSIFAR
jgi:hypothetical protein